MIYPSIKGRVSIIYGKSQDAERAGEAEQTSSPWLKSNLFVAVGRIPQLKAAFSWRLP